MRILVTGAAGFIGFHLCNALLARGDTVVGVDNLNNYYDVKLKQARQVNIKPRDEFTFCHADIAEKATINSIFEQHHFDVVVNLAAQAGVRYSMKNPSAYVQSNLVGFANILEACRHHPVKHLVFASSSSVYGANQTQPFSEHHSVAHPIVLYAATKRSNEVMAHSYAHIYQFPCTGLRYFTVYGPWGRPDMALFKFTKKILNNEAIEIYNNGEMLRDFTYVDDIVAGTIKVIDKPAQPNNDWNANNPDPASSSAPFRLYNIGHGSPINLLDFVKAIESNLNKKAKIKMLPLQPGEVLATHADTQALVKDFNYQACTPLQQGMENFIKWYRDYYGV